MTWMYDKNHELVPFIGKAGTSKLHKSQVVIIGLGGLGSPCAISLAGCSVGHLVCFDFDTVSETNLHRQTLFTYQDIGKKKIDIAEKRLREINKNITIDCIHSEVKAQNIFEFIQAADVVVDATDNFETRYIINDACLVAGKTLVYGAIHQTEGHLTVFNYRNQGATLRCLFPQLEAQNAIDSCEILGAYNIVTQTIGNFMANEVVKIILGAEDILAGKLLTFNAINYTTQIFNYFENKINRERLWSNFEVHNRDLRRVSSMEDVKKLLLEKGILVDVRTSEEHQQKNIGGFNIPFVENYFKNNASFFKIINPDTPIIVYCQSGVRSAQAQQALQLHGFNVFDVTGGLNKLLQQ